MLKEKNIGDIKEIPLHKKLLPWWWSCEEGMRMRGGWAPKHRVTGSDRVGKPRRQNTICSVMASGSSKSNNVVTAPGCESWQALHAIPWCLAGECSTGMQWCEISQGCLFRYRTGRWRTASTSGYNQRAFCTAAKNERGVTRYDMTWLPHAKHSSIVTSCWFTNAEQAWKQEARFISQTIHIQS